MLQSVFNLFVSFSVLGFVLYRKRMIGELLPYWSVLAPLLLMCLLQLNTILAHLAGYDPSLPHRMIFLVLVLSLLALAWNLQPSSQPPEEGKR